LVLINFNKIKKQKKKKKKKAKRILPQSTSKTGGFNVRTNKKRKRDVIYPLQ
jgi:hypothetical protein